MPQEKIQHLREEGVIGVREEVLGIWGYRKLRVWHEPIHIGGFLHGNRTITVAHCNQDRSHTPAQVCF